MDFMQIDSSKMQSQHNEWLGNLSAYDGELQNLKQVLTQLAFSGGDLGFGYTNNLKGQVELQQKHIEKLLTEVDLIKSCFQSKYTSTDNGFSMGDLVNNNRLREKIRHCEQLVFLLKFQVQQLLKAA
jgi:hypothetical protein